MAWTQTDLDKIDAAIIAIVTSGAQTVRFSDGREVTYYSIGELLKARDAIKSTVAGGTGVIRTTLATFSKG